jgi:ERCC4-related helicase
MIAVVKHPFHGQGRVLSDLGETVIVRFDHGIEQCAKPDLTRLVEPLTALEQDDFSPAGTTLLRLLANSLLSCNDTWGVFAPSRIDLVPHQLWVCRKVLEKWPGRWLIADDVGLGKTIEAGIVLWPLISRKLVQRLLILAPASLVEQWQYRMRQMFDIRVAIYHPEIDKPNLAFWETHNMVVASIHTLRDDRKGRHERLFNAKRWDMVLIDEAHHVNFDQNEGKTLNYQLLERLTSQEHAQSVIFFTGTPHRGRHFNFFALLKLLRPDLFDPAKDPKKQMHHLREVMIRNNKQNVKDIRGNPLFFEPKVESRTFDYSPEEDQFYKKMTEFIVSGRAYASTLGSAQGQAVILVLTVLQKLASSSVAAIRNTLRKRIEKVQDAASVIARHQARIERDAPGDEDPDDQNKRDEEEVSQLVLQLMDNEQQSLKELLFAANSVQRETKTEQILAYVRELPDATSVLFFTEYKATQAMLLAALMREYGEHSVTFINGDACLDEVVYPDGKIRKVRSTRESAADEFNRGKKRFLVSTEAAGEGIDLQEKCHNLVHVDLPWNPMRLHQRHGRLNRYGQKHPVKISLFYNPETVEGQIWQLLSEKIANINVTLAAGMEDPEDLFPLVLGMTPSSTFDELYTGAYDAERLDDWFDSTTAKLGGRDAVDTVRELVGNAEKFDFQSVSSLIPRLDLPDLKTFFETMLKYHRRQIKRNGEALSFRTPESWAQTPAVSSHQENLIFNRNTPRGNGLRVVGIGTPVVNEAIKEALQFEAPVTCIEQTHFVKSTLYVFRVEDQISDTHGQIKRIVCAVKVSAEAPPVFSTDAALVSELNRLLENIPASQVFEHPVKLDRQPAPSKALKDLESVVQENLPALKIPFRLPDITLIGVVTAS